MNNSLPDVPSPRSTYGSPGESGKRIVDSDRFSRGPDLSDDPWGDNLSRSGFNHSGYPQDESAFERAKNVLSDVAYSAYDRFRNASTVTRTAVVGAVVVGLLGGGLGAKEVHGHFTREAPLIANAEDADEYIWDSVEQKAQDKNKDPLFRATTVSLMENGLLFGSGSLVKVDGEYKLATVEHVIARIYGLADFEGDSAGVGVENSEDEYKPDYEYSFFVPGVGVIELSEDKDDLQFSGEGSGINDERKDRLAYIEISGSARAELAKAEEEGEIKVPEVLTDFSAEIGDVFYMPLADTGERIPLLYIGEGGGQRFAPLVLFSETLDIEEARANLRSGMDVALEQRRQLDEEFAAEAEAEGATYYPSEPDEGGAAWVALNSRATEFAVQHYQEDFEDDLGVTAWLPCMGDSGSPILSDGGLVVGTLSQGSIFRIPRPDGEEGLVPVAMPRYNVLNYSCLADITISTQ